MAEVAKQVKPLHDWMLAFWSNGSDRPPGFFQMRIKADDDRYNRLAEAQAERNEVQKGQAGALKDLQEFVVYYKAKQKAEEDRKDAFHKRVRFWLPIVKWVGGGIFALLVIIGGWAVHRTAAVAKFLWEDYLHTHPVVTQQIQNLSQPNKN